jgi:hypothetical protein
MPDLGVQFRVEEVVFRIGFAEGVGKKRLCRRALECIPVDGELASLSF